METTAIESKHFSIRQAKELVKDLHQPVPWIFWTDFLCSILTGHLLFALNLYYESWGPSGAGVAILLRGGMLVAIVALFMRAAMFTHELVHLPKEGWTAFRIAWNVLCGIPFLVPSFTYYPHIDHHRRKSYGTDEDAEYLNLSHQPPRAILIYLLGVFVTPIAAIIRFGIMSPICWIDPSVRKWTFRHASTMVMDIMYCRPEAAKRVYRIMIMQEIACFGVCLYLLLSGPILEGVWISPLLIQAYFVSTALIMVNNIRTLGAHRWTGPGTELTFEQQLLDSCDYPYRPWFTELWGPTGTRYHATHHLFPSLPYHNLGIAHRRLMAGLPADNIFRQTVKVSLLAEIAELWKRSAGVARASKRGGTPLNATAIEAPEPNQNRAA